MHWHASSPHNLITVPNMNKKQPWDLCMIIKRYPSQRKNTLNSHIMAQSQTPYYMHHNLTVSMHCTKFDTIHIFSSRFIVYCNIPYSLKEHCITCQVTFLFKRPFSETTINFYGGGKIGTSCWCKKVAFAQLWRQLVRCLK